MAKKPVKSPAVRRLPKVKDTLDDLDKYDPDGESDQFTAMLSGIMDSTSTILTDPRMDPSDLPHANHYLDWLCGPKFLAFQPFSRQVDIGLQLNLEVCWKCSPQYYDGPDVNHLWHYSEYRSRFQLMNHGVCPKCGSMRLQGVRKKRIFDKWFHSAIAGQRSSKCLQGDTLISTPDGPRPVIDLVRAAGKVRLGKRDVKSFGEASKASYVYRTETADGGVISPNARHRLYVSERGYVSVGKHDALKVGEHLERPILKPLRKQINYDSPAYRDGDVACLLALASRDDPRKVEGVVADMWGMEHDYKAAFFTKLAAVCGNFTLDRIGFGCGSEGLDRALLAWLEAVGVRCTYADGIIHVNTHDYARRGPYVPLDKEAHYRKLAPPEDDAVYPEAYSTRLSALLQGLLADMDRFMWKHNSEQKLRMTEVYSIWGECKHGGRLNRDRARRALRLLREWRNIAWTAKEQVNYDAALRLLRHVLTTRFTKIVSIRRSAKRVPVYDLCVPQHEWFVANGVRSHNSVLTGHLIGYPIHRLICTGDPAAYYGLLPGTVLTCILTATTMQNAERNLYTPMRNMFEKMPWFVNFTAWCKEREAELGVELIKVRESFTFFRYGGLDIRVLSPDRRRIRGSTSFATAVDEAGHFDEDEDKVRAGGLEVYSALSTSLTNVLGAAARMRNEGENDVIFPCSHAISSPFNKTDPIMTLYNQQKDRDSALTYIIPTWKFNPNLTYEMCRDIALPATFMRDYGCVVADVTGSYVGQPEALYDLCLEQSNAVKTIPEVFTSRSGAKFTVANLAIKSAAGEGMVTGLALDMSWKNNAYTFIIFHIEKDEEYQEDEDEEDDDEAEFTDADDDADYDDDDADADDEGEGDDEGEEEDAENLDAYTVVVDAIGEVQPSDDKPIHFTQMVRRVLYPLIEAFNVQVVLSDRWQTLQTQQDVMDEFGIEAFTLTPKLREFQTFRESLFAQSFLLPRCEYTLHEIVSMQGPADFAGKPVAHLIRQILTVKETPKTVEKGLPFSDDLFRVCVLAHMARCDETIREMLVTQGEVEPNGPASMVVGVNNSTEARSEVSAITFSSGSTLVADFEEEPPEDDDETPTSTVVRRN